MKPAGIVISPGPGQARGGGHQRGAHPGSRERCPSSASAWATRPSRQLRRHGSSGAADRARQGGGHAAWTAGACSAACPRTAKFTRYHSLAMERESLPAELEVTAVAADGEIMGVRHRELLVEGIQFHPESIASEHGKRVPAELPPLQAGALPLVLGPGRAAEDRPMTAREAECFMDEMTDGRFTDAQIAGVLASMTGPRITAEALAGFATVLRRKKRPFASDRGSWTPAAPAVTAWARSTSRPWPPWWRHPAARLSPSTATVGPVPPWAAPISSGSSVSPWMSARV